MSTSKDGGPAFPQQCADALDVGMVHAGMTLRDYFAGQALPAVLERLRPMVPAAAAQKAYEIADAMIGEREK